MNKLTERAVDKLSDRVLLPLVAGEDEKSCRRQKYEKEMLKETFEAGICMKTKDRKT